MDPPFQAEDHRIMISLLTIVIHAIGTFTQISLLLCALGRRRKTKKFKICRDLICGERKQFEEQKKNLYVPDLRKQHEILIVLTIILIAT